LVWPLFQARERGLSEVCVERRFVKEQQEIIRGGRGSWGGVDLVFAVTKTTTTWHARRTVDQRTKTAYRFIGLDPDTRHQRYAHEFSTLDEADAYARRSIPNFVELDPSTVSVPLRGATFASWLGQALFAVCVIEDGVAVSFDLVPYQRVIFNVWPVVEVGPVEHRFGTTGYFDALASLVGQRLSSADDFVDDGALMGFPRGALRLDPADFGASTSPELVLVGSQPILMTGEEPWSSLSTI
jgi:hypothetical protein